MSRTNGGIADVHRWHRADDYETLAHDIQFRNAALVARLHPRPDEVRAAYEIGCGTGALTSLLVEALPAATIHAVDVSAQMLAVMREKPWPDRVSIAEASFPDVPVRTRYDAVFSNAALHWMHPRYDDVFGTVYRLLRPGGLLCAATAGRTAATERFDALLRKRVPEAAAGRGGDDFDQRRLTVSQVTDLAERAGLRVEDAFVVERTVDVPVPRYARWWVASGGPWRSDQLSSDEAVTVITDALGGDGSLEMVHASVLMVLRRGAVPRSAEGHHDEVDGRA
jgi:trans-aconitate methyltransferase